MSITGIIMATGVVAVVGILIGLILGFASIKLHVDVDEKEAAVLEVLPGNNCGGCGFPGCSGLAAAIARGEAPVNQCPVGGASVAEEIGRIMGVDAGASDKQVAYVRCAGDCDKAKEKYVYFGAPDCRVQDQTPGGGSKACSYGCLGGGSCVDVCAFDAIHVVNGVAVVDKEKCVACKKCIEICPRHLITLVSYEKTTTVVTCRSQDKGPVAKKNCDVGCIGCGICAKNCPKQCITVENFLAEIDQEKCVHCGLCAQKCPTKAIQHRRKKPVAKAS
ncbi:MAG: RnfABCDGE type electron transport complex subunit B [Lachnospiraceae bacterium]|nr:RnfABCDGE type electron transport complex subunit B [Lachnospiraceae bacterium]